MPSYRIMFDYLKNLVPLIRAGETYLKVEGPNMKVLKGLRLGHHHGWRQEKKI